MSASAAIHRTMRTLFILVGILSLWWTPNAAEANATVYWEGGYMKNYIIDVILYGSNFTAEDYANTQEYVVRFSNYVNGQYNPPGFEPAVHYYGLWGVIPGAIIQDSSAPPVEIDEGSAMAEIQAAETGGGNFGVARDFDGNIVGNSLVAAQNSIKVVLVKGVPPGEVIQNNCASVVTHPCNNDDGFHDVDNNGDSYAVGRAEQFEKIISHEVTEAMTDPSYWGASGWQTNESVFGLKHQEVSDDCNGAYYPGANDPIDPNDPNLVWLGETGANASDTLSGPNNGNSGINRVTLNPSYGGANSIAADSCELWEPEQYAPIAATVMTGDGEVMVAYRTPYNAVDEIGGDIQEMYWSNSGVPFGPFDTGPLPGGVIPQGKPALLWVPPARIPGTGGYVFVRGSDNALYMNYNGWQRLGGRIYGDPSAVFWNGGAYVNVFATGTDDRIYTYGIVQGVPQGWALVSGNDMTNAPLWPALFSGPPKAISRSGSTIDVFAVGESGGLYTMAFNSPGGWSSPIDLGTMDQEAGLLTNAIGVPHHTPPSIASWGGNELDIITTAESDVGYERWNGPSGPVGGWYNGFQSITSALGSNAPSGTPFIVSWGPNRLDAFMIDRNNLLTHAWWDGNWHADIWNPFATDAVGDPVAISRYEGELEVFYRTTSGSLTQIVWNGSSWSWYPNILPNNSIQ